MTKYAQELAPIPLNFGSSSPSSSLRMSNKPNSTHHHHHHGHHHHGHHRLHKQSRSGSEVEEPLFFTNITNELICHPRMLHMHNCTKRNVLVELRVCRVVFDPLANSLVAMPCPPSIHNKRWGPFLVDHTFTSCSGEAMDPHFLDEFKLKLPTFLEEGW